MTFSKYRIAIISIFTIATIIISAATIYADTASIKIKLKPHDNLGSVSGVNFSVYKVGTVDDVSNEPVFDEKYNIDKIPKTASETVAITKKLKKANKGAPVSMGKTSYDGVVNFSVSTGIYYIEADKNNYGNIEPSLIWLPYTNAETSLLSYSVEVIPKSEPNKPDDPDKKPDIPSHKDGGDTLGNDYGKGDKSKTGDISTLFGYIGLSLLSLIMLALIYKSNIARER